MGKEKEKEIKKEEEEKLDKDSIDYIVWDLETTGFVAPNSRILEIGCFVVIDGEVEKKHWVLNNNCEIPDKIIELTGITPEIIEKEGRDPKECLLEFLPYFKKCKRNVTHNGIRFDIPFMVNYAEDILELSSEEKKEMMALIKSTAFDTAVNFKAKKMGTSQLNGESYLGFAERVMSYRIAGLKYNLGFVCDDMEIDRSGVTQHRALADVELTYKVYTGARKK